MQKVITSPEGTRKELYVPLWFTMQVARPHNYVCCTVRQRIPAHLEPDRSSSPSGTINADDKTAEKELTCTLYT